METELIGKEILDAVSAKITGRFSRHGRCVAVADYAKEILEREYGIKTEIKAGYASWRLGKHELASLSYVGQAVGYAKFDSNFKSATAVHAWLQHGNHILDFSTVFFKQAIRELDIAEGEQTLTPVTWNPKYIYAHLGTMAPSHGSVLHDRTPGRFFYKARPVDTNLLEVMLEGQRKHPGNAHYFENAPNIPGALYVSVV